MSHPPLMLFPSHTGLVPVESFRPKRGLYAAAPGTGPEGETCGSCKHIMRMKRYRKCRLVRALWTGGLGTDIKARSAACTKWEAAA